MLELPLSATELARVVVTVRDNNPRMSEETARRIVGEAVKFVAAGAQWDVPLAPSRVVDEGWHALILHTALYADLCNYHGQFVHHHPGYSPANYQPRILDRARAAIRNAGFEVDEELWRGPADDAIAVAANCQHSGGPNGPVTPIPRPKNAE